MRSAIPKPAHRLCGRPMVSFGLDALASVSLSKAVVVVGYGAERVRSSVLDHAPAGVDVVFAIQAQQKGTGDATAVGLSVFTAAEIDDDDADVVVLPGDVPLVRSATIAAMIDLHRSSSAGATVLTAKVPDPTGYGRVVRDRHGQVTNIVEHRDASPEELSIDEINTAIYCFKRSLLGPALRRITPANAQGEYYLTDVIAVLRDAGYPIVAHTADSPGETMGINDRVQLAEAEAELRRRTNRAWLEAGVTIVDPDNTYVDTTVQLGTDVTIFPGAVIQGSTVIGQGTTIGPRCHIVDCEIGSNSRLDSTSARGAFVGDNCQVGPFASLGDGAQVASLTVTGPLYAAP
ncbi:MAG: NTP transferase domain-containing protein [Actinomycetia bacterium]|nr:NTP transferase domain-containing protein [Actinomycetes bacterium]MCP4961223.1 NTP transferase domain-containing protein [Actinomycetes bacterium]